LPYSRHLIGCYHIMPARKHAYRSLRAVLQDEGADVCHRECHSKLEKVPQGV